MVTWNGNNYDIPLWILHTDEHANEAGTWSKLFLAEETGLLCTTDYMRVTQCMQLQPTAEQRRVFDQLKATEKVRTKYWKPPQSLGAFYEMVCGHQLAGYHGALADAQALRTMENRCPTLKEAIAIWSGDCQNRYVGVALSDVCDRTNTAAKDHAKGKGHGFSRAPYGESPPRCRGHGYPCSLFVSKTEANPGRVYFVCNRGHNAKRTGGNNKQCSHWQWGDQPAKKRFRPDSCVTLDGASP